MFNVLIESENSYFCIGITAILKKLISDKVNVEQIHKLTPFDDYSFDCYFLTVKPGEEYLCYPLIANLPPDKIVFFVSPKDEKNNCFSMTNCSKRVSVIYRDMSIQLLEDAIKKNITIKKNNVSCHNCNRIRLTFEEIMILSFYKSGFRVKSTSLYLKKSDRTIYAQLDRIKKKFGLVTEKDFHHLVNNIDIHSGPNMFMTRKIK
ncbi:hypothetical protein [Enterobacter huaxiensis]|uniref:hypothetical protein n=1 Tax=Enterobacter huaxiensis TaxID=2494702 RepID=UPI0010585BB6|nr:hypothetical protein [Enterobacter huaxiensis]UNC52641.1 hypothetical protein D5067_0023920 [Enterobacter huaxiensis]